MNDEAKQIAYSQIVSLRNQGIACETDLLARSFKAQMRDANKLGVRYVYIIGDDELAKGRGQLKNMSDSSQVEVEFDKIKEHLQ